MLVSVIICNYNYGRFLREAIDSALDQSYPDTEVIVVDDGSTDSSREIIAGYGDRIIAVMKENGGLASAANAGFSVSRGDVICFLDSDDVFHPDKVAVVLQAWKEISDACLVYHQLQSVNSQKEKLGKPWPRAVWRGNIRRRVERSGGWWPYPTTSGLCFSRSYLKRMLPMPEERRCFPDTYLAGPAAFVCPVIGIRLPLALRRFHGDNISSVGSPEAHSSKEGRIKAFHHSLDQQLMEFNQLKKSLGERLNVYISISIDDNHLYLRLRRSTGESVTMSNVIFSIISCPAMPWTMKWREAVKFVLNRW